MSSAAAIIDRIQWHEGMLLSPQHFQQFSARVDSLVAWQSIACIAFGWGVRKLVIDQGLLAGGLFRILELEAILPDGTAVVHLSSMPEHDILELHLNLFAQRMTNESVDVYVTLPVVGSIRRGTAVERYRSVSFAPVEDEVSDAMPAEIPRLIPNLALSAGAIPGGTHVYLRLGSVFIENEIFRLSPLLPPLLEISRDHTLWASVSNLLGQLRGKAAFVAKQTAVPSSRIDDRLAHLELKDKLRSLLTSLPMAEAVLRTPHLHPLALYIALCTLLSSLSLLRPGGLPPIPADYNHAEPWKIFGPLLHELEDALGEVSQDYREHKFDFSHNAFDINLKTDWLQTGKLVVGLRGQSERDIKTWMDSAIIGSVSVYPSLRERRVLGASRNPVDSVKELGIRPGTGYLLYVIENSVALTVPGEQLIITNANEGATAQRPQEMVLFVKE